MNVIVMMMFMNAVAMPAMIIRIMIRSPLTTPVGQLHSKMNVIMMLTNALILTMIITIRIKIMIIIRMMMMIIRMPVVGSIAGRCL